MIRERNLLIEKLRGMPTNEMVARVFGLPIEGGVDDTYGDCIQGIWKYSNNVIYYTREVCLALMKHGKGVERRYEKSFRGSHPKMSRVEFTTEKARVLMPPDADYASWEQTYVQLVAPTEGRRMAKLWYGIRRRGRKLLRKPWRNATAR